MRVNFVAELEAPCEAERLFRLVDDLTAYPQWLEIVERAEIVASHTSDSGDRAWLVDLRGRVGPLARSKRLRMVRTECSPPASVRFERRELDGRRHGSWVLDARIVEEDGLSRLVMHLSYGGAIAGKVFELLLHDAVERSRPALLEAVIQLR